VLSKELGDSTRTPDNSNTAEQQLEE